MYIPHAMYTHHPTEFVHTRTYVQTPWGGACTSDWLCTNSVEWCIASTFECSQGLASGDRRTRLGGRGQTFENTTVELTYINLTYLNITYLSLTYLHLIDLNLA